MKRLLPLLLAAALLLGPAALAEPQAAGGTVLSILNTERFAGMDQTYNEGYMPLVQDGMVHVILPLASREPLTGEEITVRVMAADDAPFVLPTYDRTVRESMHPAVGEDGEDKEISCCLAAFGLPLTADAAAGRWPLTIIASGRAQTGEAFSESFTVYVTVPEQAADGTEESPGDGSLDGPGSEPDDGYAGGGGEYAADSSGGGSSGGSGDAPAQSTPPPVPRLMLSSVQTSPYPVSAGADFTVEAALQNVSPAQAVTNVLVTIVPAGEALVPQPGQPLSLHFDRIPAGQSVSFSVLLHADGSAEAGTQKLSVHLVYEGKENAQYTAEEEILILLTQPVRLEWDAPEIPAAVHAGDTLSLAFQAMNLGRAPLYNVRVTLEGQGLRPETSLFLGNLESGTAAQGEMYVFVGMLDPDDPDRKYGETAGSMILTAEDADGQITALSEVFETEIEAPLTDLTATTSEPEPEEEDTSFQWILISVIAGAVIAVLVAVRITKRRATHAAQTQEMS